MRTIIFLSAMLGGMAFVFTAAAEGINYKRQVIHCTFAAECGPGHEMQVIGGRVDTSQCRQRSYTLTYDPRSDTLTFGNKLTRYAAARRAVRAYP